MQRGPIQALFLVLVLLSPAAASPSAPVPDPLVPVPAPSTSSHPTALPEPHPDPEAVDAAQKWVGLLDAGSYGEAWDSAGAFLKRTPRDRWSATTEKTRGVLGGAAERTFQAAFRPVLFNTDAPDPNRLIVIFSTRFGASGTPTGQEGDRAEIVPLIREDGTWRPVSYLLRSGDQVAAARLSALGMEGQPAPDFPFTGRDGQIHHLAEFRGRWLFLETGRTTCLPSENMAVGLSEIRKELDGKPFEFLHVWSEPSWDDVDLGVHFPFLGVEGWVRRNPDAYHFNFPTCAVIDPQGTVRKAWVGERDDAAVRTLLAKTVDFPLPDGFATVTPARTAQEQAAVASGSPSAGPLWKAADDAAPDDLFNVFGLLDWAHLPDADRTALRDKTLAQYDEGSRFHWQLLRNRADSLVLGKPNEALAVFRTIQAHYPQSQRMRLAIAALTTWNDDDLVLARDSAPWEVPWFARLGAGYAFEGRNDLETASRLLDDPDGGWTRIHAASFLARHQSPDQARAIVAEMEKNSGSTLDAKDRNVPWLALLRHLAAADWAGALPWADRHFALTAWNAMGPAARLLAAVRTGDDAGKEAALTLLAGYKTDRAAYLYAQRVQTGAEAFSPEGAAPFANDQHAEVAFLWLGAWLESQSRNDDAAKVYTLRLEHVKPWEVEYAVYRTVLETVPHGKP
jgi:hypothetical protein